MTTTISSFNWLATSQPDVDGFSTLVEMSNSTLNVVSFSYTVCPAENVLSNTNNAFYNKTVNVGGHKSSKIDSVTYSLYIESSECLPNYDYYVFLSALLTDGSQVSYSTPLLLPLAASAISLNSSTGVTITYDEAYPNQATVNVYFPSVTAPTGSTMTYVAAVQFVGTNGAYTFELQQAQSYNSNLGGIQFVLTGVGNYGVDECYVAVQSIRTITSTGNQAISQISNTVQAVNTAIANPPSLVLSGYNYNALPPNVVITLTAPSTAGVTDVTSFNIYRSVGGGSYQIINTITYNPTIQTYTYTDSTIGSVPISTEVDYIAKSVNANGESVASNTISIVTVQPSSAPRNLSATGLTNPQGSLADIKILFTQSSDIYGFTNNANYNVNIIDASNNILHLFILPYVSGANHVYEDFVDNVTLQITGTQTLTCKCYLMTYDSLNQPINGLVSTVSFTVGPAPVIYDVNGAINTWSATIPLVSLRVLSSTLLIPNGLTIIFQNLDTTIGRSPVTIPTPTLITSGYYFADNYDYSFTNGVQWSMPPGAKALAIHAMNSNGVDVRLPVGPF
jgi:hypothetical protein